MADEAPDHRNTPFAPGPNLWRDQISDRDVPGMQLFSDAQVKIGRIGQESEIGLARRGGGQQLSIFAVDSRQVRNHFQQTYDGKAGGIHNGFDARRPQPGACATEESRVRPDPAQFLYYQRRIKVSRCLTGRHQNVSRHLILVYRANQDCLWMP